MRSQLKRVGHHHHHHHQLLGRKRNSPKKKKKKYRKINCENSHNINNLLGTTEVMDYVLLFSSKWWLIRVIFNYTKTRIKGDNSITISPFWALTTLVARVSFFFFRDLLFS